MVARPQRNHRRRRRIAALGHCLGQAAGPVEHEIGKRRGTQAALHTHTHTQRRAGKDEAGTRRGRAGSLSVVASFIAGSRTRPTENGRRRSDSDGSGNVQRGTLNTIMWGGRHSALADAAVRLMPAIRRRRPRCGGDRCCCCCCCRGRS